MDTNDIMENTIFNQPSSMDILPIISVITVVFNAAQVLEETIKSVLEQTYKEIEYIIIDGGSSDGTLDIIHKYKDKVSYWISEKDNGIYDAMNKGIIASTGPWIHFLNAGDLYAGNKSLQHMIAQASMNASINFLYTKNLIGFAGLNQNLSYFYLFRLMINHQSIIYSRNLLTTYKFNPKFKYSGDYAHLLTIFNDIYPCRVEGHDFVIYDKTGISSIRSDVYKIWRERAISVLDSNVPLRWKLPMYFYACIAAYWRKCH